MMRTSNPKPGSINALSYCLHLSHLDRDTARTASSAWKGLSRRLKDRVEAAEKRADNFQLGYTQASKERDQEREKWIAAEI